MATGLYRNTQLRRTKRGIYERSLGKLPTGREHKFRLGYDLVEAERRLKAILALWLECCQQEERRKSGKFGQPVVWDATRLETAKAIARGETPTLPPKPLENADAYLGRVARLVEASNFEFRADPKKLNDGLATLTKQTGAIDNVRRLVLAPNCPAGAFTGQTLFAAIDACQEHIRHDYQGADGISDTGKKKIDQLKTIKSYLSDCDLGQLDFKGCDEVFGVFRRRPISRRYKQPMSFKSCQNYIGELDRFFKWLHTSADWKWRKPEDFDMISRSPRELDADAEKEAEEIPTWTLAELKVLWEFANPLERILFLLGMNCAYGADQSGRLRIPHVKLSDDPQQRSKIRRIRRKKKTLSQHVLWELTATALRWAIARRPADAPTDHVLLTATRTPYWRKTKGGNRSQDIPNIWGRLLDRVQKDHPHFRRLPFNSLRDTSGTFVPKIAGGETASLHLAHKHQTADENLRRYTNPAHRRHAKALLKLEAKLMKIFVDVADPFPAVMTKVQKAGGANISPGQISRIKKLCAEGYRKGKIAELVGVSRKTVWEHTKSLPE